MKNIVVGIDFSQNSLNALRHAVAVGLKTKAKIHIVWVRTPGAAGKLGITDEKLLMKKAQDKLDELGNAIGGTINIITKDPINNSFQFGSTLSTTDEGSWEQLMNGNVSLVAKDNSY